MLLPVGPLLEALDKRRVIAGTEKVRVGVVLAFDVQDGDLAPGGRFVAAPLAAGEEIEPAVDGDLPVGMALEDQRPAPFAIVVDYAAKALRFQPSDTVQR